MIFCMTNIGTKAAFACPRPFRPQTNVNRGGAICYLSATCEIATSSFGGDAPAPASPAETASCPVRATWRDALPFYPIPSRKAGNLPNKAYNIK
jgi:hypothetical protein